MSDDCAAPNPDGASQLQQAAIEFSQAEISRISDDVINDLRSLSSNDTFADVAARHLWDEYCWSIQEGPFDDELGCGALQLGSLSGAFDDVIRGSILHEVEKLPRHTQILLSARAYEVACEADDDWTPGAIWIDGIEELVFSEVNTRASRRNVALIGPNRHDEMGYEIEGEGTVWSVLSDWNDPWEVTGRCSDLLLDSDSDLSKLADDLVEAFFQTMMEDEDREVLATFMNRFGDDVRAVVKKNDVIPSLETMRSKLLAILDN